MPDQAGVVSPLRDANSYTPTPRIGPLITVVEDTLDKYRDVMADLISQAKQRAQIG